MWDAPPGIPGGIACPMTTIRSLPPEGEYMCGNAGVERGMGWGDWVGGSRRIAVRK